MMRCRSIATAVGLVALFAASAALADAARDALADVAKCADVANSAERLACYDAAAARAKSALAATPEAPKAERSLLDWFGFVRPPKPQTKPEEFGKPPQPADEGRELSEITAGVKELAITSRGKAIFFLDNGQTWRQIDADDTVVRAPPAGEAMKVTIERGLLGSYNLTIDGRNGLIKVNRLY